MTQETDPRLPGWLNSLLNRWPFIWPNVWTWAFSVGPSWVGTESNTSLFWNGIFFLRLNWPFGIFLGIRWSGATDKRAFLQCGFGWKLNGRVSLLFRIQSDESGAAGTLGRNYGQAIGWERGPK